MLDPYRIASKISTINPARLMFNLLGRDDIKKLMIRLNTENQLKKLNENPFGIKLYKIGGKYSPKYAKRKKIGRSKINLNLDGDYYQSFRIVPFPNGSAKIVSNKLIHGNKSALAKERWGEVEGLNEKNTNIVLRALDEEIYKYVLS